jgi:pimeloyl-ACP methyl ester carboxylesterase
MSRSSFTSLAPAEILTVDAPDGAALPVYGLGGPPGAPALLFGHANGLAAGSYAPWLGDLAGHARVFAFDARDHGGARWPEGPLERIFAVDRFADDLGLVAEAVATMLGGAPLHYAGHSLGAAAGLRLLARGGVLPWKAATLFEPPIFPPPDSPHRAEAEAKQAPLISRSATRRELWPSVAAFRQALTGRGLFAGFRAELLAAHCAATLRPLAAGGYRLCSPPAVESAIFAQHRSADTWARLAARPAATSAPLHLVSGDPERPERDWVAPVMPALAALLPGAHLSVVAGASHMMIFEQPEACRDVLLADLGVS